MSTLTAVIVNYNTTTLLRQCLDQLHDLHFPLLQIIVVDNASTDESTASLIKAYPQVKFIINSKNVGLAAANNQALKLITSSYIIFLGTDTFVKRDCLDGLISYMDTHKDVGIATCKLKLRDGALDNDAHRYFPTPLAVLGYYFKTFNKFPKSRLLNQYYGGFCMLDKPHEIDMCIAHFMLVRRSILVSTHGWDEDYFVYAEDMDLCYQVKELGWKIMYLPQWEALHYKGASVGVRKSTRDISKAKLSQKIKMYYLSAKGLRLFYLKHYQKTYIFLVIWLMIFFAYSRATVRSIKLLSSQSL